MTEITIKAKDLAAWRGWRGSGDLMNGTFVLQLRPINQHVLINISGTRDELDELKQILVSALESETW